MRIIFFPIWLFSLSFRYLILKFSLKKFLIFNSLLIISLFFLYLFQLNIHMKRVYLFKDYQQKKELLLKENNELKIALSHLSNFENLKEKIKERNFQKAHLVKYIQLLDTDLVIK